MFIFPVFCALALARMSSADLLHILTTSSTTASPSTTPLIDLGAWQTNLEVFQEFLSKPLTFDWIYYNIGVQQCRGLDKILGVSLYETLMTIFYNGHDFGGSTLCTVNCNGTCEPYKSINNGAPYSAYPFGCKCAKDRCDANGPILDQWVVPGTQTRCDPSPQCDNYCKSFDPSNANYTGYICNWWNLAADGQHVDCSYDPNYAIIRWCNCCPN